MGSSSPTQLSLGVSLHDEATFENFFVSEDNASVVSTLQTLSTGDSNEFLMLWGRRSVGLSHLMQAACQAAHTHAQVQYLPLEDLIGYSPEDICEGLEYSQVLCVDNLEQVCGHREWEQALFHVFNRFKDQGNAIVFASHSSPATLPILLPDLKSRLMSCLFLHVKALQDEDKIKALILRAKNRGIGLGEDVAKFMLLRLSRDMSELVFALDQLDEASLQEKRRLTIPFVKEVFTL